MKKILFVLFSFLFLLSCNNKNKPVLLTIKSDFVPSEASVLVFTPESYSADKKYPLVILLHGWNGNHHEWSTITGLQQFADAYNFVIASPDGFRDSWYINSTINKEMQYEDFFWKDLIPELKSGFSLDTNNFFISGLSMGGHGAITLFLKNPQVFKSAGSTSGILDLTYFPNEWGIKDRIGSLQKYPEVWKSNSAFYLLDSTKAKGKKIFIDCGTEDFAYQVNLNFAKKCQDLGFDFKFISIPGKHSYKHWRKMIDKHFEFFFKQVE